MTASKLRLRNRSPRSYCAIVIRFIPIIVFIFLLLPAAAVPHVRRPSNRSRFASAYRAGPWGRGIRRADSLQSSIPSPVPRGSEPDLHRLDSAATGANTARPTAQSVACVVWVDVGMHIASPTEAHLDARG